MSYQIFHQSIRPLRHFWRHWISPIVSLGKLWHSFGLYSRYISDWKKYASLANAETLAFEESKPCLFDNTTTTPFDAHYFYQAVWASHRIAESGVKTHLDIGSATSFVGTLTSHLPTIFLDYRPLQAKLHRLQCVSGNILELPVKTGSVLSLSCLHVIEHIGLGRYGDPLNPLGTQQACRELTRVLSPGGNLYLSTPIGHSRTQFNAHRIHQPTQIIHYFDTLELKEFSAIDDQRQFHANTVPEAYEKAEYACGLFWFQQTC